MNSCKTCKYFSGVSELICAVNIPKPDPKALQRVNGRLEDALLDCPDHDLSEIGEMYQRFNRVERLWQEGLITRSQCEN